MPGYRSSIRLTGSVDARVNGLIKDAENIIVNGVSNRSWTQMGSDWLSKCSTPFMSLSSFLASSSKETSKGYVIAQVSGQVSTLLVGPIAGKAIGFASAQAISSVQSLFNPISEAIIGVVQGAFSEWAGDQQKALVEGSGTALLGVASRRIFSAVQGCKTLDEEIPEIFSRLQGKSAEFTVRFAQFKSYLEALQNNTQRLRYCDDAVALSTAFYQLDALRSQVDKDLEILEQWVAIQRKFVNEINMGQIKEANLEVIIKNFMNRTDVPHYTAYSWNVISRNYQCSEVHCYGKGVS